MNCPRCGGGLRDVEYEGAIINTCDACGGELMGAETLRYIVRRREMRFDPALSQLLAHHKPRFGLTPGTEHPSLTCPGCGGAMRWANYGGDTGIIVDRCEQCHAVFLDHEELEKVQLVLEQWEDEAPARLRAVAHEVTEARRTAAEATSRAFSGSRFAFVNAVINRLLDAA